MGRISRCLAVKTSGAREIVAHQPPTTTTSTISISTLATSTTTADPGGGGATCPVSLKTLCIGWVRGNSNKLHALAKVGGVFSDGSEVPINGATVEYSTTIGGQYNSAVETETGTYVFNGYQDDFDAACGERAGVTGNANCFETAPEGAECEVTIDSITHPDPACSGATFDADSNVGSCVFAGRYAPSPCATPATP